MSPGRPGLVLLLLVGAATLAGPGIALAKEGARARLAAALPLHARAGATIRVAWTVDVPDGRGGREPFGAGGMFVRLLSRTGAAATIGFDSAGRHPAGRYVAAVPVPAGGIGGVRVGLRGRSCGASGCRPADVVFPLENDPFVSPAGVRCDVDALAATLRTFARAYNRGDLRRLDRLFSDEPRFVWYSSADPGARNSPDASNRATLISYFRGRYRASDRFSALAFRFNGYDPQRDLGHFELRGGRRRAGGRWFRVLGKVALDCSKPPVTIAVLSLGGPLK